MIRFSPGACCDCPPTGTPFSFLVRGCSLEPMPGALVEVYANSSMTTLLGSAVANASGVAVVYLPSGGSRYVRVPAPHVRFNTYAATVSVSSSLMNVVQLAAATGYTCCYGAVCPPGSRSPIPRGPIRATTSGGQSWDFVGCSSIACVLSDPVPVGPAALVAKTISNGSGGTCSYLDFPEITTGRRLCRIFVSYNSTTNVWSVSHAAFDKRGHSRIDPMTYQSCTGPVVGTPEVWARNWVDTEDCTTTLAPHVATVSVVSCNPFVLTATWPLSTWESRYPWGSTPPATTQNLFESLTLVEL